MVFPCPFPVDRALEWSVYLALWCWRRPLNFAIRCSELSFAFALWCLLAGPFFVPFPDKRCLRRSVFTYFVMSETTSLLGHVMSWTVLCLCFVVPTGRFISCSFTDKRALGWSVYIALWSLRQPLVFAMWCPQRLSCYVASSRSLFRLSPSLSLWVASRMVCLFCCVIESFLFFLCGVWDLFPLFSFLCYG